MATHVAKLDARLRIRRIIFATDFSAGAEAALPYAARLARRFDALVYVVHVIGIQPWELCPELTLQARIAATLRLDQVVASEQWRGVRVQPALRHGGAVAQILHVAETNSVDLVVTGAGSRGLRHMIMGSVAQQLAQTAPCPVLTVGANAPLASLDQAAAASRDGFKNIVLAIGMNPAAASAITYARRFAQAHGARLWIAHSLCRQDGTVEIDAGRKWARKLAPDDPAVQGVSEPRRLEEVAVALAQRTAADLVMLAPGLAPLLAHMVQHVACPVMAVRYAVPMIRPKTFGAEPALHSS